MKILILLIVSCALCQADHQHKHWNTNKYSKSAKQIIGNINGEELYPQYWNANAQDLLSKKLASTPNTNVAKNVIFFLGDGMSIPTLKAARVYWGQLNNETGEERFLSFEKFPYTALSRTYCVDVQVPDSACTATAFLCGVKANDATLGLSAQAPFQDCEASLNEEYHVSSIARWSQLAGKKTGLISTARITHATPAAAYSHTADRDWECDADDTPSNCEDIASQLISSITAKNLNVIMGGGKGKLLPNTTTDEEGVPGERQDGRDLIEEWLQEKAGTKHQYVWNRTDLNSLNEDTEYLLGLFESDHCKYHLDANEEDPSLEEMTEAAIKLLSRNDNGFFLFIEGGRIDHAHHDTFAQKALDETVELSKAIQRAYDLTNPNETLIVVTADHAHVFSMSGYPKRGNDIFGIVDLADDGIPYSTISYANGPGYKEYVDGVRHDVSQDDMHDKDYMFPTMVPRDSETHGGDDVAIFATGPWSHLFTGSVEQNFIPHALAYASCVGDGLTVCDGQTVCEKS